MYLDPTYILVIIGAIISGIAALNVKSTYSRYAKVASKSGMTADEVARRMLQAEGINDVRVERIGGELTDHYSPKEKVLRLSDTVYGSTSVAAIGVAAHECGHAVQHHQDYMPLQIRSVSVPVANIGSKFTWPVVFLGILLGIPPLAQIGVALFMLVVFVQLVTLPVEFNASHRAIEVLENRGILASDELPLAKKVLGAAALTYVAALFNSILQLVRLILITRGRGRRRD